MIDDEGWEARMAARARERQARAAEAHQRRREADVAAALAPFGDDRSWLHGWPVMGDGTSVLIGTGVHCIGCGYFFGVTCVAFDDGWEPPNRLPEWPLSEGECVIHRVVFGDESAS